MEYYYDLKVMADLLADLNEYLMADYSEADLQEDSQDQD